MQTDQPVTSCVVQPAEATAAASNTQKTPFFALLRQHTIEGMFADPMHGGNAGMVGWKLIGYPGPQMNYRDHIDRHHGKAYRPAPATLRQVTHQNVRPWEDEGL